MRVAFVSKCEIKTQSRPFINFLRNIFHEIPLMSTAEVTQDDQQKFGRKFRLCKEIEDDFLSTKDIQQLISHRQKPSKLMNQCPSVRWSNSNSSSVAPRRWQKKINDFFSNQILGVLALLAYMLNIRHKRTKIFSKDDDSLCVIGC